jgi:hypothetical protein
MTVSPGPVIEHCPNCGAPLDLVAGSCRWCGEHVTMRAAPPRVDYDDEDAAENAVFDAAHDRFGVGDIDSWLLPIPTGLILSGLATLICDRAVQAFLEGQPDLLDMARRHTDAVKAAGERASAAFQGDRDISQKELFSFYSADEMWTFDLGADLIAWLADVDGVHADKKAGAGQVIEANDFDPQHQDPYTKPLKEAGDGPAGLRELRARVPRRGRYDAQGRKLPDPPAEEPPGHGRRHHWRR